MTRIAGDVSSAIRDTAHGLFAVSPLQQVVQPTNIEQHEYDGIDGN
jgi:hypothetical protein